MKLPTVVIQQIDTERVLKDLRKGKPIVYECTYQEMKCVNNAVRSRGYGLSAKAFGHDLETGAAVSYRFQLMEPSAVKRRPKKEA